MTGYGSTLWWHRFHQHQQEKEIAMYCQKSRKTPGKGHYFEGKEEWGKAENWKQEKGAEDSSNNGINVVKMLIYNLQSEEVPCLGGWKSYRFHKIQCRLIPCLGTAVCLVFTFISIYSYLFLRQFLPSPAPTKATLHKWHFAGHRWGWSTSCIPIPKFPQHIQGLSWTHSTQGTPSRHSKEMLEHRETLKFGIF